MASCGLKPVQSNSESPSNHNGRNVPGMGTFYLLAEKPVLNHQQQACRLIAQVIAPDGPELHALHLAAQSGLKDKFGGSLTVNPITEYEFRQCFQSDSSRSSGSFNLNPGVLLWHLVRMN